MNRILALQTMRTQYFSDALAASNESVKCSSESTQGCSSQSISCQDNQGFALEW